MVFYSHEAGRADPGMARGQRVQDWALGLSDEYLLDNYHHFIP